MLRIGLTGGIGSGKTTVANLFAELGSPVIDTDEIAHQLTTPGAAATREIARQLGSQFLNEDASLNRRLLREAVFQNPQMRQKLEAVLHPLIKQETLKQVAAVQAKYCIIVVPLLIESGWQTMVDRILVVDLSEDQQIERTRQRDQASAHQVRDIIKAQASRQQRLAEADDVIVNDGDLQQLRQQVNQLHQQYSKQNKN